MWGFLYGWTLFLVIQTGTIAAVGVAFGKFLGVFFPAVSKTNWIWHYGTGESRPEHRQSRRHPPHYLPHAHQYLRRQTRCARPERLHHRQGSRPARSRRRSASWHRTPPPSPPTSAPAGTTSGLASADFITSTSAPSSSSAAARPPSGSSPSSRSSRSARSSPPTPGTTSPSPPAKSATPAATCRFRSPSAPASCCSFTSPATSSTSPCYRCRSIQNAAQDRVAITVMDVSPSAASAQSLMAAAILRSPPSAASTANHLRRLNASTTRWHRDRLFFQSTSKLKSKAQRTCELTSLASMDLDLSALPLRQLRQPARLRHLRRPHLLHPHHPNSLFVLRRTQPGHAFVPTRRSAIPSCRRLYV